MSLRFNRSVRTFYVKRNYVFFLNNNHLGIVFRGRACELVISAYHIGFACCEAEHHFPFVVEHHEVAFGDKQAGTVCKVFPVEGFTPLKRYLDEFSFYHCYFSICIISPPYRGGVRGGGRR